jgi:MFS transporter, DHA2 family, multidrug resistance protein
MNTTESKGLYRWGVLGIIMMGTFMAILDSSIVNVALPHIMSAFGVNRDKIEWVATAFMMAMAVTMPLVAWLVNRLGHKVLYLTSLTLFTIGSALCAFAWSYDVMIISRVIQAIGGGAIQPVGMAIVADLFEPRERGKALGIWGTGIMVGPTLGPTLGGYLTDTFNWRTIFSVNIPIGIITVLIGILFMKRDNQQGKNYPFDIWGFSFLSTFLISALLALSKGQEKGWTSTYILTCLAISVIGAVMFLAVEATVRYPILELNLFKYRNFTLSMVLAVYRAVGLFGGIFLLPIFLQNLAGYTTIQAGLWMMPGAMTVAIMMPISGRLADHYQPKWLVSIGVLLAGLSLIMYGYLDPISSAGMIIGPQIVRGIGLALMMAPLLAAALNSVPKEKIASVSSFLNIAQSVGGSFGIAILNSFVTNSITKHSVRLGELFSSSSVEFQRMIHHTSFSGMLHAYTTMQSDIFKTQSAVAVETLFYKANVMGFENGFVIGGIIVLSCIPFCFFLKPALHHRKIPAPASETNSK